MSFGFLLYCVLDVARSDASEIRNLPKLVWLAAVVLVPLLGGIAWLVAGRPGSSDARGGYQPQRGPGSRSQRPSPGGHPSRGAHPSSGGQSSRSQHPAGGRRDRQRPSRVRGPDDDPEFLRKLDERLRRRDDRSDE